jgi:hypothetical protein
VSAAAGKRKEERGGGPLREMERWAVGQLGQKEVETLFLFFLFLFQTLFKIKPF